MARLGGRYSDGSASNGGLRMTINDETYEQYREYRNEQLACGYQPLTFTEWSTNSNPKDHYHYTNQYHYQRGELDLY